MKQFTEEQVNEIEAVAGFFDELSKQSVVIDFCINSKPDLDCGRTGCFGGYLGTYYNLEPDACMGTYFYLGAAAFATVLGFESVDDLSDFIQQKPDLWGCSGATEMFHLKESWLDDDAKGLDDLSLDNELPAETIAYRLNLFASNIRKSKHHIQLGSDYE